MRCAAPLADAIRPTSDEVRMLRLELQNTIGGLRGDQRGAQGRQRGSHLDQRGAAEHQRGARDQQGRAAVGQRRADHGQHPAADRRSRSSRPPPTTWPTCSAAPTSRSFSSTRISACAGSRRRSTTCSSCIHSDIGRPVTDLAQKFSDDKLLLEDARAVLQRLVPVEREVRSHSGRWYLRRTLPYRTVREPHRRRGHHVRGHRRAQTRRRRNP